MCYASSTAEGRPLLLPVELTSVETNVDVGPPGGGGAVVWPWMPIFLTTRSISSSLLWDLPLSCHWQCLQRRAQHPQCGRAKSEVYTAKN